MNIKAVLKTVAILLMIVAGFMIFPTVFALYYGETESLKAFAISMGIVTSVAGGLYILLGKEHTKTLNAKSGFLMVTLSWSLASLFGALPFYISGAIPCFADAYFETISGFSTTGASILTAIEPLPRSILFWRSLTHWLGGMGIVVLTVAILPILGIGGLQLLKAEAPGPTVDKITSRITETAKILWLIYLGMTVIETVLLMFCGMDLFDALTHTFGTLATGGFSTKNSSVGAFNSAAVDWIITIFMVLAGINFTMHYRILTGKIEGLKRDTELKAYLAIFFISTLLITINLWGSVYDSISEALRYAGFQAASILTTTGYATTDYEKWPYFSQIILFVLMFVGGCSGSTGGGIKVIRIVTLFKKAFNEMKFLIHPRGIFVLKISGNPVKKNVAYAISGFFFLYVLMLLFTTLVVSAAETDPLTAFTTALATVGNIGPGFGLIGPAENYAFYPPAIKWFLSFAMLVGRLELYTVLVLFTPGFYRK